MGVCVWTPVVDFTNNSPHSHPSVPQPNQTDDVRTSRMGKMRMGREKNNVAPSPARPSTRRPSEEGKLPKMLSCVCVCVVCHFFGGGGRGGLVDLLGVIRGL